MDDNELEKTDSNLKKIEEQGIRDTLKYFDRLHDKLFTFNNILIAGFFTLSKLDESISVSTILFPIVNLIILIYIEYRGMKKSRHEAEITIKINATETHRKIIQTTNLYSLLTIVTTFIVTSLFLYYLIF